MAVTRHTFTGNVKDILANVNAATVRVYVETNLDGDDELVDKSTDSFLLGKLTPVALDADGAFAPSLPSTAATTLNVDVNTLRYRVVLEYPDESNNGRTKRHRTGWFELTAAAGLGSVTTTPSVEVAATGQDIIDAAAVEADRAEAAAALAVAPTDTQMETLVNDPASATSGALSATYVPRGITELDTKEREFKIRQDLARFNLATGASYGAWSASAAASSIASPVEVDSITSNAPNTAKFTFLRGDTIQRGATWPNSANTKTLGIGTGTSWTATEATPLVLFRHSGATVFEVRVQARGDMESRLRVRVDGRWIEYAAKQGPANDGQQYRLPVTLPSTGEHEVAIEFSGFITWFRGITVGPTASVKKVWHDGPRLIIVGDSQTEGANGVTDDIGNPLGFAWEIGRLLGIEDTLVSGIGSTGWLATADGTRPKVRDRLQGDVIDRNPDWVHFAMGQNDASQTYAGIKAEVEHAITTIRAALPNTVITFQSQFHPVTGAGLTSVRAAIKDAADAAGCLFVDMTGWLKGTGYQGAENGTGNMDQFVSVDSSHLSPEGHLVAGRKVAAALALQTSPPGA